MIFLITYRRKRHNYFQASRNYNVTIQRVAMQRRVNGGPPAPPVTLDWPGAEPAGESAKDPAGGLTRETSNAVSGGT